MSASYSDTNLQHSDMERANQAFKNLRIGAFFGRKIKVQEKFIFPKDLVIQQLTDPMNTQLEVFITLENGEIFVYLDGQGPGGTGGNPQGVAKSPG